MAAPPHTALFKFTQARKVGDFHINCIGARARSYFPDGWFEITDTIQPNEEGIEWLDMLETVATAGDHVVFADIGAGYGRWLVNAALAARQLGKSTFLIGVEAETQHYRWMLEHLADNDIRPAEYRAIHAPISDIARDVYFSEGHAQEWYGQSILPTETHPVGHWLNAKVTKREAIPAASVFESCNVIDGVHIDIQGEEARVVPSLITLLTERVRRIHIGTHDPDVHSQIGDLFDRHGWTPRRIIPLMARGIVTELGPIDTNDGVQSWRNPRFD